MQVGKRLSAEACHGASLRESVRPEKQKYSPKTKRKMKPKTIEINGVNIKKRSLPRLPRNKRLGDYSRELRKARNLAEVVFWKQVHKGKFHGLDFTRQMVIGNYIADFCVRDLGLVVEVDGGSHIGKEEYDAKRDAYMESLGLKIFRVTDKEVLHDMSGVKRRLEGLIVEEFGE